MIRSVDTFPNTPEAWKSITVRHLLTHTAGFPGVRIEFKTLPERRNYTTGQLSKPRLRIS
jgi:CubicO group peptidase (beta-lactamase class C family)